MCRQISIFLPTATTSNIPHTQKETLAKRNVQLKEELSRISPEALEELEREVSLKNESEESPPTKNKKQVKSSKTGKFIKKSERRRKPQPKIMYT